MDQGLWPRFFLQVYAIGRFAEGKIEFEDKLEIFRKMVMPELENLHDTYHKINDNVIAYKHGVANGEYFSIKKNGHSSLDRKIEIEISRLTKNFTVQAKGLLEDFTNCGFCDDLDFKLRTYLFTEPEKFVKKKDQYSKLTYPKYLPLLNVIEKANQSFLLDLKNFRELYYHDSFSLDKFELQVCDTGEAYILEPILGGVPLSGKLTFFYENLLDFFEKMMVYYAGINAEDAIPEVLQLHVTDDYNYAEQRFKYTCSISGLPTSHSSKPCKYD
jgi:hypothetical protein